MTLRVTAGGVAVTVHGGAVDQTTRAMERLAYDGVPAALMSGNASLWGSDAAGRAAGRLGWVDLPRTARGLLPELAETAAGFGDIRRVLLAGTGGAAAAAEAIARAAGARVTVLDVPDPRRVRRLIDAGLDGTVLVVADKSGATVETDCLRRVFERAFREAGADPAERVVVVTDPGSPLEAAAKDAGHRVILSAPDADGPYAALTASALVPAALAGADVAALLDDAAGLAAALGTSYDNPGLALGAALGGTAGASRRLVLAGAPALARWVEQLVAVATGKDDTGVLPVVVEEVTAPGFAVAGRRAVVTTPQDAGTGASRLRADTPPADLTVSGPLGAQFLLWEYAAAVAARLIGIDPFDAPEVRAAGDDLAALLRGADVGAAPTLIPGEPVLVDGDVEVHGDRALLDRADDLSGVVDALLDAIPKGGYLAVTAYLDPEGDAAAADLRPSLARRAADAAPVVFGWGPRSRHATGQYHRGGPPTGVFLQITGETEDLAVPGRPYGLRALQLAQAFADLRALRSRGRPAVRLHLRHRAAGLARLASAVGG